MSSSGNHPLNNEFSQYLTSSVPSDFPSRTFVPRETLPVVYKSLSKISSVDGLSGLLSVEQRKLLAREQNILVSDDSRSVHASSLFSVSLYSFIISFKNLMNFAQ